MLLSHHYLFWFLVFYLILWVGCFEEAIEAHKEEVHLSEAINDTIGVAVGNRKLGECFCELGQFEDAIRLQKQHLIVKFKIFYLFFSTTIPHDLLIKDFICFVFVSSCWNKFGFCQNSVYWTSKGKENRIFDKDLLGNAITLLIKNCYFSVTNTTLKQDIGIPMCIYPAPFWANLFLYHFEIKHILLWFKHVLKSRITFI